MRVGVCYNYFHSFSYSFFYKHISLSKKKEVYIIIQKGESLLFLFSERNETRLAVHPTWSSRGTKRSNTAIPGFLFILHS